MRRDLRVVSVVAMAAALAASLVFCTPFGQGVGSGPDGSAGAVDEPSDSTASTSDAATPQGDATSTLGPGTCFDFRKSDHSFVTEGNANRTPEGFVLTVGPTDSGAIWKTLDATDNIQTSTVTLLASATISGNNWSSLGFIDLMGQYLGASTSYATSPAMEINLRNGSFDLNVWNEADMFDKSFNFSLASVPAGPATLRLSSAWSDGETRISFGTTSDKVSSKQSGTQTKKFSIVIGRGVTGTTPTALLTVHELCVNLE